MAGTLGAANPLRYRGYVYDTETGLYYLQSRYYNPEICRFINIDSLAVLTATPGELTDKNLFAYCDNNPVNRQNDGGRFWHLIVGAIVGVASQYVIDVASNLAEGQSFSETLRPSSTIADYGAAAISGALAASGIGMIGSIVANAALGGTNYMANCLITHPYYCWSSICYYSACYIYRPQSQKQ